MFATARTFFPIRSNHIPAQGTFRYFWMNSPKIVLLEKGILISYRESLPTTATLPRNEDMPGHWLALPYHKRGNRIS